MIAQIVDHLWQSTLMLCVAGLLTLVLRRNGAHGRYWLWFAASMKFLLPLSLFSLLIRVFAPPPTSSLPLPILAMARRISAPITPVTGVFGSPATHSASASAIGITVILLAIWALGSAAHVLVWMLRWIQLRRAISTAKPLPFNAPIPVRECPTAVEPSLFGIWRPVVIFPHGLADRLSADEIRSILAHELSHYRRRDNLTAALHMMVQAVFWFYPPIWWLGARLLAERERACDEAVLDAGVDAEVYASGILKVCRFFTQPGIACASGVSGSDLKQRVEAIMSDRIAFPVSGLKKAGVALALGGTLCASILLGTMPAVKAVAAGAAPSSTDRATLLAEQTRPQKEVPFNPADFDRFVGYYELSPNAFFHIYRRGGHYFTQLTGQGPVEVFPESSVEFFATVVAAQIRFVTDSRGEVTGLVLHQNGYLRPAKRVAKDVMLRAQAALQRRIKDNMPDPGTAAAIRRQIESFERTGQALYGAMAPPLAAAARQQAVGAAALFKSVGAFEGLRFYRVLPIGIDVYVATFAHGKLEISIAPLSPEGKITGLFFHPIP